MALTPEALIERRKGIGGSDAAKIVEGGEAWHTLWLQKLGKIEDEDLSRVWPVQLGVVTESLNLDFYEWTFGRKVEARGSVMIHKGHPIIRATFDGIDFEERTVVEAKHVNGFSNIATVRARYEPQVRHQMIVGDMLHGILSVIIGAAEPVHEPFEHDAFWAAEYIDRCEEFWSYVTKNKPPPGAPKMETIAKIEKYRTVDFTGDNVWAAFAADWLAAKTAAAKQKTAEKALKELVDADVGLATGHNVQAKRRKDGVIVLTEMK